MEKFVLSKMRDKNFSKAVNEIYLLTDYNKLQYPGYCWWYYGKNIPRIINGEGEVIFCLDGLIIAGLVILKKTKHETKICTLYINEDYRKKGYAKLILEEAFEYLGTEKPVITIPEKNILQFSGIISAYDWKATGITDEYYSPEIIFNGSDFDISTTSSLNIEKSIISDLNHSGLILDNSLLNGSTDDNQRFASSTFYGSKFSDPSIDISDSDVQTFGNSKILVRSRKFVTANSIGNSYFK